MFYTRTLLTLLLFTCLLYDHSFAKENCFSCIIKVDQLNEPLALQGNWLFTREDHPQNADKLIDESKWITIRTPGPWNDAYEDKAKFAVGWYRAHFQFAPELIGKQVVFYVDTYMSKTDVFLDGTNIYSRGSSNSYQTFYALQPIPVTFQITQESHTIAVRIETFQMVGIFQLPFQLRPYKSYDPVVTINRLLAAEIRNLAAYICLVIGLFFLLVYVKTKYSLYAVAAFAGIGIFPYYGLPHENMVQIFEPLILWKLHYIGIPLMTFSHFLYAQYFAVKRPRATIVHACLVSLLTLFYISQIFWFEHSLFDTVRKTSNLYCFAMALPFIIDLGRAARSNPKARVLFLCEMFFLFTGGHDLLISRGLLQSTNLMFLGTLVGTSGILYMTSVVFADTFVENKALLASVREINQNLEKTVEIRTADLKKALDESKVLTEKLAIQNNAIKSILDNVEYGLLRCDITGRVLNGYSRSCLTLFAHQDSHHIVLEQNFLWDLLQLDERSKDNFATLYIQAVEDDLLAEDLITLLPRRIHLDGKSLAINGAIIRTADGKPESVLFSLADITTLVNAEMENENNRSLLRILKSRSRFIELLRQTFGQEQSFVPSLDRRDYSSHRRTLHTWKGDFSIFGLSFFSSLLHQIEDRAQDLEMVENELSRFRQEVRRYLEENQGILGIQPDNLDRHLVVIEEREILILEDNLSRATDLESMKKIATHFVTYAKSEEAQNFLTFLLEGAKDQARKQGKDIEIELRGGHVRFPQSYADMLTTLIHLLRNAVDHGIEAPYMRGKKSPKGKISIEIRENESDYSLILQDDGAGIDLQAVGRKAIQMGLLTEAQWQAMDLDQKLMTIFLPGFTTRSEVSEISGRGIGLDAVAETFTSAGGTVRVESTLGQGTTFILTLPRYGTNSQKAAA